MRNASYLRISFRHLGFVFRACFGFRVSSFVLLAAAGCGGDGIDRHQVSGTVTYQGKQVQDGRIMFEPDASIGKIAPTGFAQIEGGRFQTTQTESPTTGKYKVRVFGYDKSKMKKDYAPGEILDMPELFPEYTLEAEIPPPGGKLDIEVPARR
jgi:hypothetical protein